MTFYLVFLSIFIRLRCKMLYVSVTGLGYNEHEIHSW
uniref:Uncharacterized protein n=1 Tax=Anguilla anguilla TaxID=7936 RepID=A0A0E9XU20_ANGAN